MIEEKIINIPENCEKCIFNTEKKLGYDNCAYCVIHEEFIYSRNKKALIISGEPVECKINKVILR